MEIPDTVSLYEGMLRSDTHPIIEEGRLWFEGRPQSMEDEIGPRTAQAWGKTAQE